MIDFSTRIKELRIENGINQRELARISGLSPQCISAFENGTNSPTVPSLLALSNALNVSTDYLLGRTDEFGAVVSSSAEHRPQFSETEQQLITYFRQLPRQTQSYVFGIVQNLVVNL